jgi:hypothetical protein
MGSSHGFPIEITLWSIPLLSMNATFFETSQYVESIGRPPLLFASSSKRRRRSRPISPAIRGTSVHALRRSMYFGGYRWL